MLAISPILFRGAPHTASLPAESLDFQVCVGRPAAAGAGPAPCVLVLTRAADREIDDLSLGLAASGIAVVRLDADRAAGHDLCWHPGDRVLTVDGVDFRPEVCWSRYFAPPALRTSATDARVGAYARAAWGAMADALAAAAGVRHVNAGAAPDRLRQLEAARAAGLATPATVVTTDLAAAAARIPGDGDLLVKPLGEHAVEPRAGELTGLAPHRITRAEAVGQASREPAPVIVQEHVAAPRELRVYAVAGRLHAFAVEHASLAGRWDREPRVEAAELEHGLAGALRRLVAEWRLDVAAFDVLDGPAGPVFLEVNQACDWLWCERRAGVETVSTAVRELIGELMTTGGTR
jgi:hypothetical protein